MRYATNRECLGICNNDLMSVPRPTMHQTCNQGCLKSFLFLSSCRKYYQVGTIKGWQKGHEFINNLLDDELAKQRRNLKFLTKKKHSKRR